MKAVATVGSLARTRPAPWGEATVVCGAIALGGLSAVSPLQAIGLVGVALLVVATFVVPVGMLTFALVLTTIVPYEAQNAIGVGGGAGAPGLLVSDLIIGMGIVRAIPLLLKRPLEGRSAALVVLIVGLLLAVGLQTAHGLSVGRTPSAVGAEARVLVAFGVALVTLPILEDAAARERLWRGMVLVGIGLGLLGVAQWVFQLHFAGDFGVRQGVSLTTAGKGQIQGGLYGFPVAVVVAFAVLSSGRLQSTRARIAVSAVLALNAISLLLTFERSFWVATVLGAGLVWLRAGRLQRARLLVWGPICLLLVLAALSSFAPATLGTARERLTSIGQYANDASVRVRLDEARHVIAQIDEHPLVGSGFGATIAFGRPWEHVPVRTTAYSHNGYLWLAWKMGIPVALLLTAAILGAGLAPSRFRATSMSEAVRNGCQASLLALLTVSVTFPAYNSRSITAAMGMMLAMSVAPGRSPKSRRGDPADGSIRAGNGGAGLA